MINKTKPNDMIEYISNQLKFNKEVSLYTNKMLDYLKTLTLFIRNKNLPHTSFLDIGCRNGSSMEYLSNEFPDSSIYGVDIVQDFVDKANDVGDAEIMDMHMLKYDDRQFDWVTNIQTLEHAYDIEKALSETLRVAKIGVFLSINVEDQTSFDKNPSHYCWSNNLLDWFELLIPYKDEWSCVFCYRYECDINFLMRRK